MAELLGLVVSFQKKTGENGMSEFHSRVRRKIGAGQYLRMFLTKAAVKPQVPHCIVLLASVTRVSAHKHVESVLQMYNGFFHTSL